MVENKLHMKVDMNIVQHLGISMYSTLPPVIAELVSNSWDADATEVLIELYDKDSDNKRITIRDNGYGMSIEDIQNCFLVIGKNRRKESDTTRKGRKIIGRKGIGKLSMFGIADEVIITTVKEINGRNLKNRFRLNLNDMKSSGETYYPPQEIQNEETEETCGTIIDITKIRRKSSFDAEKIAVDLARRFLIFDENFKVRIKHNDDKEILVEQQLRFKGIYIEFKWDFPNDRLQSDYEHRDKVKGEIFTADKPVPEDMKGIYLVARGKLIHRNDFYGIRSSDYAHAYLTGWISVDFIDEDPDEDNIATNRQEITWEKENLQDLRVFLQKIISFVTSEWRNKRKQKKESSIKEHTGIDIPEWLDSLDPVSLPIARKLVDSILRSEILDVNRSADMISYIHEMFEFDSFRKIAAEIIEEESLSDNKIIELMNKWEIVEAREMYKLSQVRIDTIKNFEKLIKENAKEVPTIHNFFKKFPWLLDPRIMEFRDEVRYSELLKEKFQETNLNEVDRRIDFMCTAFGGTFFIIELKRPGHILKYKDIEQAKDYRTFLERHKGNEFNERVIAYIVVGSIPRDDRKVKDEIDTQKIAQKIYVRTYDELLQNAINYHKEFIERYKKLRKRN